MTSRFATQVSWLSFGRILASVVQAVSLVVLARTSTPDVVGIVMVFISFATIPQVLFDAGISTYVIRERAISQTSGSVSFALSVGSKLAMALGALTVVALYILGLIVDSTYWTMLPLAVWIAAERNADLWLGILVADGDAERNVLILIARRLTTLLVLEIFMLTSLDPILGFSVGMMLSAILGIALTRRLILPTLGHADNIGFGALIDRTRSFWLNSTFAQGRNIDGILVTSIAGPVQAGFYSMGTRLINPLRILPDALAGVMLPAASREGFRPLDFRRKIFLVTSGMTILFVSIALACPWVVPLFLGASYAGMVPAIQMIVLGLIFGSIASMFNALLMARGHAHHVALASGLTTVFCILGVVIGSSIAEAFGAALGAGFSFFLQAVIAITLARWHAVI